MEKQYKLQVLSHDILDQCVDIFMDTFSKEPWNDVYDSKEQVVLFFENHINNNYFVGYVLKVEDDVLALSIGMKKPWINGMEYYIDEFCVKAGIQGKGIGSQFLRLIEEDIKLKGMNAIILNTEKGFPAEQFYIKNGFSSINELVVLAK